jgi:hypothetical protein
MMTTRTRPASLAVLLFVAASMLRAQEAPKPGFLVVAPEKFAKELGTFVEHKSKRMPTELLTLEAALREQKGVDEPEQLKRAMFERWKSKNVHWVLLVGDCDVMPVRWMALDRVTPAALDYAFYASDLYYADLAKADGSFEDWNGAKDGFHAGYFGEVRGEKNKKDPINYDGVDYKPEIAIGRWPVSTAAEVRVVAEKSMRRDAAAAQHDLWLHRVGAVAIGGWVDGRPTLNAVTRSFGPLWGVEKRYYADAASTDKTAPPTEEAIVRLLNEGCGLLCHTGHGADDRWEQCFSTASLAKLTNAGKPAIMISCGCSTARFSVQPPYEGYVDVAGVEHKGTVNGEVFTESPPAPAVYQRGKYNMTGLGERLLRDGPNGAVVYIGCNTGSQPCGLTLLEGFGKAAGAGNHVKVGDAWKAAVVHYWDAQHLATIVPTDDWYPASIFFQGMKFMLFGDPTLEL